MQYVYIVQCADGTYYTGWTNDLTRRLAAHNSGRGAKYTRGRGPVRLVFSEIFADKGEALGYEAALKKLSRIQKQNLIASQQMPETEYLDIYDADGRICGTRPRAQVHRQGLRHAVVHLWAVERRAGRDGIWLQRRALDRPLFPGLYDLSATGHVDAGETPLAAVCREAREEIGAVVPPEQLQDAGVFLQQYARNDGGFDDELAHVFVWQRPDGAPPLAAGAEVMGLYWTAAKDFASAVDDAAARLPLETGDSIPAELLTCRRPEEWQAVRALLPDGTNR